MESAKIDPSRHPLQIKDVVKNDESGIELYEYYDEEYSGSDDESEADSIRIISQTIGQPMIIRGMVQNDSKEDKELK